MRPATCEHPDGCTSPVAGHIEDVKPCPYCGPGPCRSTARTTSGADLERFERHHPRPGPVYLCAPHIETVPAGRPVHVRLVKYRPSSTSS